MSTSDSSHCTRVEDLRIVFAGTPSFSANQLQTLIDGPYQIVAVYTQPDRRTGRGKKLMPSPVKALALQHELPVFQPSTLRSDEAQDELKALSPDIMIVVAYGLLLPRAVLDTPHFGCINIHASLLPRWRGAAPIERAIEAGDTQTGITIMQMDAGLDTGAILQTSACPIDDRTTGDSLREQLSTLAPSALHSTLDKLVRSQLQPEPQNDQLSCYADKLNKHEALLDWSQSAATIARKVRAFRSANVAFTHIRGERIKIWMAEHEESSTQQTPGTIISSNKDGIRVACGHGILTITELQLPSRKALPVAAVLNASQELFSDGQCFTSASGDNNDQ